MLDLHHFPIGVTLCLYLVTSIFNSLEEELLEIGGEGDDQGNNEGDLFHRLRHDVFLFAFVAMPRLKKQ